MDAARGHTYYAVTAYDREIIKLLERMNSIVHMISVLLETPLMKEVAKVPMLKPPITRTNMIRMDIHFRATMELYDYLVSYTEAGYKEYLANKEIARERFMQNVLGKKSNASTEKVEEKTKKGKKKNDSTES